VDGELAFVLDALHDALLMIDRDRRIVRSNRAARELLGTGIDGQALSAVLRHPAIDEAVTDVIHGGGRNVDFALRLPVRHDFRAQIEPLPSAADGAATIVLVLHDLTEEKRTERMRADFVANASHEIRTPLTSLVGFIETLKGPARDDPGATAHFLDIMEDQAMRMKRLVEDLLSLSRIEMNEHTRPTGRVDLAKALYSVRDSAGHEADEKGMTIEIAVPIRMPAIVGDTDEVIQLFQNLIGNAIKYGSPGTAIEIDVRIDATPPPDVRWPMGQGAVAVAVRDHGEGIAPEHLPRLTERFYRVDTARSRRMGGTGLGLAIVKHVISRHRGALDIQSKVGKGSVFTTYWPVPEEAVQPGRTRDDASAD
jgi:two-component system phosphate regulon sensor histidine kinase PhoR